MNRRNFIQKSVYSAMGASVLSLPFFCGEKTFPNIILIVVDDLGWMDVGCNGNNYYDTPNIDQLALEGTRFTNGYASCAVCSPTRAALLTGRHPVKHGITTWINPWIDEKEKNNLPGYIEDPKFPLSTPKNHSYMELSEKTIAEFLKENGYQTCHIGKWHLGGESYLPENQGFDINIGGCDFGQPKGGSYFDPYHIPHLQDREEDEYLTDREREEALKFIRNAGQEGEQPFFLYLAHYAVHVPIQGKKELIEYYQNKKIPEGKSFHPEYAAMVHSVDESVGKINQLLKDLQIEENTMIIFTSDNGGLKLPWGEEGKDIWTDNSPLRDGKGYPYEGGIREPYIFKWKGKFQEGFVSHEMITSTDILPTILNSLPEKASYTNPIDGINLLPILSNGTGKGHDKLFWHFPHYWAGGTVSPYSIIRSGHWKLIYFYEDDHFELYDLEKDIGEENDLSSQNPQTAEELKVELFSWLKENGAKFPKPNPHFIEQ